MSVRIHLRAIESHLPGVPISSGELDALTGGVSGRIEKNTGVLSRYHVTPDIHVADMGAAALSKTLTAAGMTIGELDLLIYAGASFDYPVPHTSVLIKSKLADDLITFPCLDVDTTCLSFLTALDIANLYLTSERYHTIAIVSSEIASRALTPKDEKVFGLFGDAAVAVILQTSNQNGYQQGYTKFTNFPSGALYAHVPVGGAAERGMTIPSDDPGYYFRMNGKSMIRLTTQHLDTFLSEMEDRSGKKIAAFDALITHQTSKYGNQYFEERYRPRSGQVIETLSDYGNCISASIPLGLEKWHKQQRSPEGKCILLLGTGAGLTLGAMVLEF